MRVVALLLASVLWPTGLLATPAVEKGAPLEIAPGTSTWINRNGSVLVLDRGQDGLLQGYFVNNAPGKGCRGIPYALDGRIVDGMIAFHVTWRNGVADCPRQTEWRGEIRPSNEGRLEIHAAWEQFSTVVAIGLSSEEPEKGTDLFTLQTGNELLPEGVVPGISVIP